MQGHDDIFRRIGLICPRCRQAKLEALSENAVRCCACDVGYPREGRLVDLLPERSSPPSIPQYAMESSFIISIYDSMLWRRNPLLQMFMGLTFDEEACMIVRALRPKTDDIVLDLACGTGIYGRRIAAELPGSFIIGLDLSRPMLDFSRKRFDAQGFGGYLLIHGDAQDMPLQDGSVDAALCSGALHLFPEPEKALKEAGRVVKPGGIFAAAAYYRRESWLSLCTEQMAGVMGGIHGLSLDEYRQIMREAGFGRVAFLHEGPLWTIMSGVRESGTDTEK